MVKGSVKRRAYDNSGREAQANATRRRIVASAHESLIDKGYAATTMSVVAARAGVSVETIYKHFGTKRALIREVLDVAIAGDDDPIAVVDRPAAHSIASAPTAREMIRLYARHIRDLNERMGPIASILLTGARSGEAELQDIGAEADAQRLTGSDFFAQLLVSTGATRPDLEPHQARDVIWTLNSPDVHRMLTVDRGWSADDYEELLARTLAGALLANARSRTRSSKA